MTEASWDRWSVAEFAPVVTRAIEWFGEDRLLFGSDWPVCLLAASYGDVVRACEDSLSALPPQTRAKTFERNAAAAYCLL